MLSVRPDRQIDPLTLAIMREVHTVVEELGLTYFICGAMARDILLLHVHGLNTGIATVDVDFAVSVEDWAQFEDIKAKLTDTGRFKPTPKQAHRLYYSRNANSGGYPLDIIPFGGVESPPFQIAWPPDKDEVLNVVAYREALANSVNVEVESDFVVPVTSLPGLTLLKLFAWADRGNINPKDALDLALLLRTYHEAGNQDRLYIEEQALLEDAGFDLEAASPRLLGKDVRRIASPKTFEQTLAILNDAQFLYRLMAHMAPRLRSADDPIATAEALLEQFKAGLDGK